jgi:hypothetical protein
MLVYIRETMVDMPLYYLWRHGFMWGGMSSADVCSSLTGVPSHHWVANEVVCDELLLVKFNSILVTGLVLAWWIFLSMTLWNCLRCIFGNR